MWVKTKNVINLENQLNVRWPRRDRTSDGTIGDPIHQTRPSGHNPDDTPGSKPAWDGDPDTRPEVRDKDIDSDFNEEGTDAQMVVDHMCKLPNFASVCRYLIYRGRIYHARNGFRGEAFDGDPHLEHIHYEGAWSQSADENDSFDFQFEKVGSMATAEEIWTYPIGKSGLNAAQVIQSNLGVSQTTREAVAALTLLVKNADNLDEAAVATAMAPLVVSGLIAAGIDTGVTPEELEAKIREVFADAGTA